MGTMAFGSPANVAALLAALALESGGNLEALVTRLGEVQANPTANTVLERLKAITTALASVPVTGPLTDAQLRAVAVPVSGPLTDTQMRAAAVPVSGPLTDAQMRATAVPVSGPLTDTQLRASAVAVYDTTGQVWDPASGTALTVKRAIANIAASQTDSQIVASVANRKIRVLSVFAVTGATATNLTFNSKGGGAGTAISPLLANAANGGEVLPRNVSGWFETNSGEALTATTGAGATTGIGVNYVEVP